MLRAHAVTINPRASCPHCALQHGKRLQAISIAAVVSHEEGASSHSYHYLIGNEALLSTGQVLIQEPTGAHCALQHGKKLKAISIAAIVRDEVKEASSLSYHYLIHNEVLLSTAHVLVQEPSGNYTQCRALLDSGSQVSFISRPCATRLNLEAIPAHLHVDGVGSSSLNTIDHFTRINLRSSHDPTFSCKAKAYLVPEVTANLPTMSFADPMHVWPHLNCLRLADPGYNLSRGIDLLLGADCFPSIMCTEVRPGTTGLPMAQATVFGWVILGPVTLKVQVSNPTEHGGQDRENNGNERDVETSSSRYLPATPFDDQKHSQPCPCWPAQLSLSRSSHARRQGSTNE